MIRPLLMILLAIGWYASFYWGLHWKDEEHRSELEEAIEQSAKYNKMLYKQWYEMRLEGIEERIRMESADAFLDVLQTTCENSGSISISDSEGYERFYVCTTATFL